MDWQEPTIQNPRFSVTASHRKKKNKITWRNFQRKFKTTPLKDPELKRVLTSTNTRRRMNGSRDSFDNVVSGMDNKLIRGSLLQ
ncbi:Hypothetical protein FKW44_002938, partial [Caligus rogercresseyi]